MAGQKYLSLLIGAACLVGGCNIELCEDVKTTQVPPGYIESAAFLLENTIVGEPLFEGEFPHGVWQVDKEEQEHYALNEGGAGGEGGAPSVEEEGASGTKYSFLGSVASAKLEVDPRGPSVTRSFLNEEGEVVIERWAATSRVEDEGEFLACVESKYEVYDLILSEVVGDDENALSTDDYFNFVETLEPIIKNDKVVGYLFQAEQIITTTERYQGYQYRETYLF